MRNDEKNFIKKKILRSCGSHTIRSLIRIREKVNMLNLKQFLDDKKRYKDNWKTYERLNERINFNPDKKNRFAVLGEWNEQAGTLGSYFWQDLWAARHICSDNPTVHYDIGSRIDGFIGHLCSFREDIVLIDVRPFDKKLVGGDWIYSGRC